MAGLPQLLAACDIVCAGAARDEAALLRAARRHFALDDALDLPWLKAGVQAAPRRGRWDRLALTGLEDDLSAVLRRLASAAMRAGIGGDDAAGDAAECRGLAGWHLLAGLSRFRALL